MYKTEKKLGNGRFGSVYLGTHTGTKKMVAIKRYAIARGSDIPYQVLRELSVIQLLRHPNIIQFIDIIDSKDLSLVMEFGGENLDNFYRKTSYQGRLQHLRTISYQIMQACAYLHRSNIMHRDLKPDNILILTNGTGDLVVKLCDMGLAKKLPPLKPRRHSYQSGTLHYRPPELFDSTNGTYGLSADSWCLGCVLYEYVLGREIFPGGTELVVIKNILQQVPCTEETIKALHLENLDVNPNLETYHKLPGFDHTGLSSAQIEDLEAFRDMVLKLLVLQPTGRATIIDSLYHYYFAGCKPSDPLQLEKSQNFLVRTKCPVPLDIRSVWVTHMIDITASHKLNKQTLVLAVNIFDRFICSQKPKLEDLKLLSIVSLLIASKYIDIRPLSMERFENLYKKSVMCDQERVILKTMRYVLMETTLLDIYNEYLGQNTITSGAWATILEWLVKYEPLLGKNITDCQVMLKKLLPTC